MQSIISIISLSTLCLYLATSLHAFEIRPIADATVSVPASVSWLREFSDEGVPTGTWFFGTQDANDFFQSNTFEKTSKHITVSNPLDSSGTISVTFTTPGTFVMLAFDPNEQAPFFTSPPTITVHDQIPTTALSTPATGDASSFSLPSITSGARDHSEANPHSSHVLIIIGSVVGGIFFLLFVAILSWCWCRRTRVFPGTFHRDMMVRANTSDGNLAEQCQASRLEKSVYIEELTARSSQISLSSSTAPIHINQSHSFHSMGSRSRDSNQTTELGDNIKSPTCTLSSMYTSYTETSQPSHLSIQSIVNARTDRQMQIQEQMMSLYRKMIESRGLSSSIDFDALRNEIWQLEELQNSDWALELTDVHPHEQAADVGVAV
ncbi:hypothetical protein VKT23_007989 [Stygiomarasmius scandens]|uniref:Uncharacterized protein n=1 Tax=Marasmiellus scandens TaxID=2682957 RepID=A0ABR1JK63_9AGAR